MIAACVPQADEHERSLISSVLYSPDSVPEAVATISAAEFRRDDCQRLWLMIQAIHQRGEPVTLLSLAAANGETLGELEHRLTIADLADVAEYRGPLLQGDSGIWRWHAQKVQDASRKRRLAYFARDIERAAMNGEDVDDVLARATEGLRAIQDGGRSEDRFSTMTCAELAAASCDLRYLIDGLLVDGQPGGIFGPRKSLKTNVIIDLALSLGTGSPFLSKFYVTNPDDPKRVAVLSGESGAATIQETARRVALAKRWSLDQCDNVLWGFDLPNLGDAADLGALRRFVERNEIRVLFIDPTYLCMPVGDAAGNLFIVGGLLKGLTALGQDTGATILLCHHTRKGRVDQNAPPELDDIAWAGFQEWVRQWLIIGRRTPYDPDSGGRHELWLNAGGSAGHSSLWAVDIAEGTRQDPGGRRWEVAVQSCAAARRNAANEKELAKLAKDQEKRDAHRAKALRALESATEPLTMRAIGKAAGLNATTAKGAIEDLSDEGSVEKVETKKNGRKETAYRLVPVDLSNLSFGGATNNCSGATVAP